MRKARKDKGKPRLKHKSPKYPELQDLLHTNPKEYFLQVRILNRDHNKELARNWRINNHARALKASNICRINNKIKNIAWLKGYFKVDKLFCQRCGYNKYFECIEGHHINSADKKNKYDHLGRWLWWTPNRFKKQFLTIPTLLLCRNCHTELHAGGWIVEELNIV